jgi:hypothetical protein
MSRATIRLTLATLLALAPLACRTTAGDPGPERYRLTGSGEGWSHSGEDAVLEDLRPRYPTLFRQIFETRTRGDLDTRAVRRDLEHVPVDRRNYDALNAVAIGYFELNHRAQINPGGPGYFDDSFRAAKLLGLPWKAYGLVAEPALRDAILDFFEDAGSGEKLDSASTAPRLAAIVASLEAKEDDAGRRERIRALARSLERRPAP